MRESKSYTIINFYKQYVKDYNNDIDYKLFKNILEDYNKELRDSLLLFSEELVLPYGLGSLSIVKYKPKSLSPKSLSIDYKTSKLVGKRVYHLNEHTGGYKYRLYWSKIGCQCRKIYKYSLNLVRANKRLLASLIINNKTDYIEL